MKLPFRKRKPAMRMVPADDVVRRFMLDTQVEEADQLLALLGIPALDEDAQAEEEAESHARVTRVLRYAPLLGLLANSYSRAMSEYLHLSVATLDDEEAAVMQDLLDRVLTSGFIALIGALDDLGILTND